LRESFCYFQKQDFSVPLFSDFRLFAEITSTPLLSFLREHCVGSSAGMVSARLAVSFSLDSAGRTYILLRDGLSGKFFLHHNYNP
jgi:hypothetical protein